MSSNDEDSGAALAQQVRVLRRFNRLYTQRIGVVAPYLDSPFSLTEVRILYELAHGPGRSASALARALGLDPGYLSRILRRFAQQGWLARSTAPGDGRQSLLALTEAGHRTFAPLQQRSRDEAAQLLRTLDAPRRQRFVEALQEVEQLLQPAHTPPLAQAATRTVVLRQPQPGDLGWVVEQHGALYAREYGLNGEFEALVAEIAARMLRRHDPAWERGWIAELDGQRVGSVFVVRKSKTVAQLRLLLLTPPARGLGLGRRLTDECTAFARSRGYARMVLWTHDCLTAARAIYARSGFRLVASEPYHGFGRDLVGEHWELKL